MTLPRSMGRGPGVHLLTVDPNYDQTRAALAAALLGQVLIITPSVRTAELLNRAMRRVGAGVTRWPEGLGESLAGYSVVGGRSAVWASMPRLAAVLVLDEHDEGLQHESSPTWHAREIAVERARRAEVPCVLISPCPSLEAETGGDIRSGRRCRAGRRTSLDGHRWWWSIDEMTTRGTGLFSSGFVEAARRCREADMAVVCVLNRTGRARLLACRSCGTVAECDRCGAALRSLEGEDLECGRCGAVRPAVCLSCGSTGMKVLRAGVTHARDDLEALLGERVGMVTAAGGDARPADPLGVAIGTEAVLHRVPSWSAVPVGSWRSWTSTRSCSRRAYRAAEEALALLVSASRMVGGRDPSGGGGILVQTRRPRHPVLEAAVRADPSPLVAAETFRRELLGLPPAASIAAVGGEAAEEWIERLGTPVGIEVQGPRDHWWLVRGSESGRACGCLRLGHPSRRSSPAAGGPGSTAGMTLRTRYPRLETTLVTS